jgi:hypothetical protein
MKKKQKMFLGFVIMAIMAIITITGCASFFVPQVYSFPEEFIGTWERNYDSSYTSTLTFTSDTLQASNQDYYWILKSKPYRDDIMYIIEASNDPTRRPNVFAKSASSIWIKLDENGNLFIKEKEDDSNDVISLVIETRPDGSKVGKSMDYVKVKTEDDWNGSWRREQ